MERLGIRIDAKSNAEVVGHARTVSDVHSLIAVLVIPTDEEPEIARQSLAALSA